MSDLAFLAKLLAGAKVEWKPLGELGELVRGQGLPKSDFTASGVPAIHYGQIYTYYGLFTHSTISFVSPQTAATLRQVDKGDVIITNTSENFEDVGTPLVYFGDEPAVTGGHATIFKPNGSILGMYLAYFTQTPAFDAAKRKYAKGIKVIDVSAKDMAKIAIPIPCPNEPEKSLEIQDIIVRILNRFTELNGELITKLREELAARRKQCNYYSDLLLKFTNERSSDESLEVDGPLAKLLFDADVEWRPLGDHSSFEIANSGRRPVKSSLRAPGKTPYYGANNIQGYIEGSTHNGEYVLIAEDGSASLENYSVQYVNGEFWANNHVHVVRGRGGVNTKYLFHYLTVANFLPYLTGGGRAKLTKGRLVEIPIPIPCPHNVERSLTIQSEIVQILNRFEAITNSLKVALPREIALRKQQYEYYRNLLFNFPNAAETVEA